MRLLTFLHNRRSRIGAETHAALWTSQWQRRHSRKRCWPCLLPGERTGTAREAVVRALQDGSGLIAADNSNR